MISPRTNRFVIVAVLTLIGSVAWGGEPNEPPIHLEFEISPTPLGPYSASKPLFGPGTPPVLNAWRSFASAKPAYAADIVVAGPTYFLPFPGRGTWEQFLTTFAMQRAGLSEGQKALVLIVQSLFASYPNALRNHMDPNHPEHLWLYAVTAEDARKMAQAYYQFAHDQCRQAVETRDKEIRDLSAKTAQEEKRIAEVDAAGRDHAEEAGQPRAQRALPQRARGPGSDRGIGPDAPRGASRAGRDQGADRGHRGIPGQAARGEAGYDVC